MLPRISEQSNIPAISLSVALMNLQKSAVYFHTNQFHPSTDHIAMSSRIIELTFPQAIATTMLNKKGIRNAELRHRLGEDITNVINDVINHFKKGKYNQQTQDLTVNGKSLFVYEMLYTSIDLRISMGLDFVNNCPCTV